MERTAFTNCHVFVGDGRILNNATVVVAGNQISRVTTGYTKVPKTANVIDLKGNWLLPGFVDIHVHFCLDGTPQLYGRESSAAKLTILATEFARRTLMAGVTTIRDLGGMHNIPIELRNAINAGLIPGPRMLCAGRMICITGGHGYTLGAREADGPEEVIKAVREQLKSGADVLKFMSTGGVLTPGVEPGMSQMSFEELEAGIREAKRYGKRTATHAQGLTGILNALEAGIDTVEHGYYLDEECIDLMLANNTILTATCSPGYYMINRGVAAGLSEEAFDQATRCLKAGKKALHLALDAGVPIAAGSDAGTPFNLHGENLMELVLLHRRGLTGKEALMAGTSIAARALGLDHRIGCVEPGYEADLVAISGDPMHDMEILAQPDAVRVVMQGGKLKKYIPMDG